MEQAAVWEAFRYPTRMFAHNFSRSAGFSWPLSFKYWPENLDFLWIVFFRLTCRAHALLL